MNQHPRLFQTITDDDDGYHIELFVCFESIEDFSDEEIQAIIEEEFEKNFGDMDTIVRCLESRINIEKTVITEVVVQF